MSQVTQLATVMVPVRDLDGAIDHYVERLGFEKRVDVEFSDGQSTGRWVEVAPPGADTTIALTPERGDDWRAPRMTGVSLRTGDIDATHARLREAGVDVDAEITRIDGPPPPMFWFRDGDGNQLLMVEQ